MRIARLGALAASLSLVATGAALVAAPAQAADHDAFGQGQGATWLAGQVANGLVPGQYGGNDYGLSIDTAFALRAAGGHDATVAAVADAVQSSGLSYLDTDYTYGGHHYTGRVANATGKAMALLQTLSSARTTVGSVDLQARLESLTTDDGPSAGRIADTSFEDGVADGQDYANSIGQAFAAYALGRAGSGEADEALTFLLDQQCPGGGFRLAFTADRSVTAQSCTAPASADVDTTAIVLQQLNGTAATPGNDVDAARTAARAYLLAAQKSDGSWGGGTSTEGSNSNSTGLAATALGATTPTAPQVESAAQWLRARQVTYYDLCDQLTGAVGAVAYDPAALQSGRTDGIPDAPTADQFRRATAQALPALAYVPVDPTPAAPQMTGSTGYLKAGSRTTLTVTGLHAGDQLCLRGSGTKAQQTSTGSQTSYTVTLASGTADREYIVRDGDGHYDKTTLKVLGNKTLSLGRSATRVKRSGYLTVTVRGLASGEATLVTYAGRTVRSTKASTSGTVTARFAVGRSLGTKTVRAYGQFSDIRRGSTTFTVVR